jgi:hypothetical protein
VDFEAGRAAVLAAGPPDAVVGRWPGLVCVAQGADPAALAGLLDLCAAVSAEVGGAPGRALARRLAVWLSGEGAGETLRFGTLAVADDRWAVFLSGSVELVVPEQDVALSGSDSAAWTDRLLPVPERPVALALEGVPVPPDMSGGVHDLRLGVVPGGGVVLVPGTGAAMPPAMAPAASPPMSSSMPPAMAPAVSPAEPAQPSVEPGPAWPLADLGGLPVGVPGNGAAPEPEPVAEAAPGNYPPAEYAPAEYAPAEYPAPEYPAPEYPAPEYRAPEYAPAEYEPAEPPSAPAWEPPPAPATPPPVPAVPAEGRHEAPYEPPFEAPYDAQPVGAPDPDEFATAHVGTGQEQGPVGLEKPAVEEHAHSHGAPAEVGSPPPAADPGPPLTPPGASTSVAGAVTPSPPATGQAISQPPRRAERIFGVEPAEPPRAPLDLGAPVTAADGEERSETTVLDQQPKAQGHLCSRGHLNDPRSHFCVLCGIRMNERTGVLVVGSRPPLGLLVFDDGSTYTVDAEYLVGRMPEADQRVRSGVLRAIIIEDRSGSVSRVHAEVRLNGWDVMLVDSGSRNGTYLSAPGEPGWTPLPPHQSRRMTPGTKVRLGARTFTFESPSGVR